METMLRPNQARARTTAGVFAVLLLSNCFLIYGNLYMLQVMRNPHATAGETYGAALLLSIAFLANWVCTVATVFFFIRWFRRAYFNLHLLDGVRLSRTEGWAAGAWFVPFINLYLPFFIFREIWMQTQRNIPEKIAPVSPGILWVWWAGLLASYYGVNILGWLFQTEDIRENMIRMSRLALQAEFVVIPAILLTIYVVLRTASFEKDLFEARNRPDISDHLINP